MSSRLPIGTARRLVFLLLVLAAAGAAGAWVRPHLSALGHWKNASQPAAPLSPALWTTKVEQFRWLSATPAATPTVVFLGDSTTDWINIEELMAAEGARVLNRGIAGDTTEGVSKRLVDSVPAGSAVCFLLIGFNDILQGNEPRAVATRVMASATRLIDSGRAHHVVVESIPAPSPDAAIAALNRELEAAAAGHPATSFLDLAGHFAASAAGEPPAFADRIHFSAHGSLKRLRLELAHLETIDRELAARLRLAATD